MANAAHITRRSIFKLAPSAVLAAGGAIAAIPADATPLTLVKIRQLVKSP